MCAAAYFVAWSAWLLVLDYNAVLHKDSGPQRGFADGRLVVVLVAYLLGCHAVTGWFSWRISRSAISGQLVLAGSVGEFVGYLVVVAFTSGFPVI